MIIYVSKHRLMLVAENFGGTEFYSPNFQAAVGFLKMLAGLILHSKQHICPIQKKSNKFFQVTKV